MLFRVLVQSKHEEKGLPLRNITAKYDIDTSILSKIRRSERLAKSQIASIISKVLGIEFKKLRMLYLIEKIQKVSEAYFKESIKEIMLQS